MPKSMLMKICSFYCYYEIFQLFSFISGFILIFQIFSSFVMCFFLDYFFILFLEGGVREEDNNRSCSSSNRGKQWLWHQHSTKNDNKNSFAATWILVNCRWHTFLSNWVTRFHVMPLCEYTRTFVCTEVCVRLKENVCVRVFDTNASLCARKWVRYYYYGLVNCYMYLKDIALTPRQRRRRSHTQYEHSHLAEHRYDTVQQQRQLYGHLRELVSYSNCLF